MSKSLKKSAFISYQLGGWPLLAWMVIVIAVPLLFEPYGEEWTSEVRRRNEYATYLALAALAAFVFIDMREKELPLLNQYVGFDRFRIVIGALFSGSYFKLGAKITYFIGFFGWILATFFSKVDVGTRVLTGIGGIVALVVALIVYSYFKNRFEEITVPETFDT